MSTKIVKYENNKKKALSLLQSLMKKTFKIGTSQIESSKNTENRIKYLTM